jgi:hypothetical protein
VLGFLLTVAISLANLPSASALPNHQLGAGFLKLPVASMSSTYLKQLAKRQDVVPTETLAA